MDPAPQRSSLVDDTELALRAWLATGSHRPGDRLPPELELAAMLGVSRGTLRTALDRLEEAGEITRRQGSGTYVGQAVRPTAFHEGLEVLRPYSELAERRGVTLTVRDLEVAEQRLGAEVGEVFGLPADTPAWTITRTVVADGEPVAVMRDVVRPGIPLPADKRLRRAIESGGMVLDVLLELGVQIAFAVTHVRPRIVSSREPAGRRAERAGRDGGARARGDHAPRLGRGGPALLGPVRPRRDRPAGAPQPRGRGARAARARRRPRG